MKPLFVKSAIILAATMGLLTGCEKDDATPVVAAAFAERVALRQQQSGAFPSQRAPELTITVDKISDSRCPEDVVCVWGGEAETTLTVRSENGTSQVLTLWLAGTGSRPNSATVPANGRRYLVVLHAVTPYPKARNQTSPPPQEAVLSVQRQ